jgi:ATP-dependent Clp protease ATP-binding subunit ClpX
VKQEAALPSPSVVLEALNAKVFGQSRAKQDLAVAVYNHYLSQAHHDRHGTDLGRHHILLIGPTGVGKTYLVKILADFLGVPVGFSSAAGLVEAGYKGNSVETLVAALLDRAGGDPRRAERGIVFIDELDKVRRQDTGGLRDISGEGVQNALLTLLDGRLSQGMEGATRPAVDTSRLLFICTGAFVGLSEIVERRLGAQHGRLGFAPRKEEAAEIEELTDQPIYRLLCQAQTSDLVEYGLIPELIGRFATVTVLHELTRSALRAILSDSIAGSALERQKAFARIHGIELVITDEALNTIADEAVVLGTGARGLHRLIGRAVDAVDCRWPELADAGVNRVVIGRECILDGAEPTLERGPAQFQRMDAELRAECFRAVPAIRQSRDAGGASAETSSGITDTRGWKDPDLRAAIDQLREERLGWRECSNAAKRWWITFEEENGGRLTSVYLLCEELRNRGATIGEFFNAYAASNTDNIQANLHYMDFMRIKQRPKKD